MKRDYDNPRYYLDTQGRLWHGPLSPDNTLHYARYHGYMTVPPFEPIWVLERTEQPDVIAVVEPHIVAARHRVTQLENAIRWHKTQWLNGDDKCWKDNETLYSLLPEGYVPPERDETVELAFCQQYIKSCHAPHIVYVSPQRRIEELETQLADLHAAQKFERDKDTIGKSDEWTVLALRVLNYLGCEELADKLDNEVHEIELKVIDGKRRIKELEAFIGKLKVHSARHFMKGTYQVTVGYFAEGRSATEALAEAQYELERMKGNT